MIISIDVGSFTMGYVVYSDKLDELYKTTNLMPDIHNNKFISWFENIFLKYEVVNIFGMDEIYNNEKIYIDNTIGKLYMTMKFMKNKLSNYLPLTKTIIIENQMESNSKTNVIFDAIISYILINFPDIFIVIINPTFKNKLHITELGKYCYFIEKHSAYTANKNHTKFNFTYLINKLNEYNKSNNKELYNVDKNIGHVADAFFQMLYYIVSDNKKEIANNRY